ncbi:DUF1310 family protein [uncultured Granulicatella sp.]|uniref:DUF1310 family protein n=1 Tax=uncultured Granulicatella sp. TaxID=316089 RepID=UPI0028056F10|nr:DUF1310 family protein [uncultured Granulicatella sp.]
MNTIKKLVIGLVSVLAILGLVMGGGKIMKQLEYNEMKKVVYSDEAHQVYKKDLLYIDKNAFSEKGIIKTYNISSFERNPMGGIIVYLYVNENENYHVSVFLHKNTDTGNLMSSGGSWSPELEKLVKENKYE